MTHMTCAKRILRYLKGTAEHGLLFRRRQAPSHAERADYTAQDPRELQAYVDSDWAGDADTRRSQTGYVFLKSAAAFHWRAFLQRVLSLSSTEAEYLAASEAARDAVWLRRMLQEIGVLGESDSIPIYLDNAGAQLLAEGSRGSARTRHIDVRAHFIRQAVEDKVVAIQRVPTRLNTADCLTKSLPRPRFEECRSEMGVVNLNDAIRAASEKARADYQ